FCDRRYFSHALCSLPHLLFFSLMSPPPPRSTLFPYTTLFRSTREDGRGARGRRMRPDVGEACLNFGDPMRVVGALGFGSPKFKQDRKSTRLNSSHRTISYAVFCLKKKKKKKTKKQTEQIHINE